MKNKELKMKNKKFLIYFLLALLAMQMFPALMQAQPPYEGYSFSYDDNGDRELRRYSTSLQLKSADTSMTEATIGIFNIKIYPNPTKGQLTLNIAELGRNDKLQMFLYDFTGNELAKMDFSTRENTIDMSRQLNGTYYLRVIIGEQTETFKIIKMD